MKEAIKVGVYDMRGEEKEEREAAECQNPAYGTGQNGRPKRSFLVFVHRTTRSPDATCNALLRQGNQKQRTQSTCGLCLINQTNNE